MSEVVQNRLNGMIVDRFDRLAIANAIEEVLSSQRIKIADCQKWTYYSRKNFKLNKQIDIFLTQYVNLLGKCA